MEAIAGVSAILQVIDTVTRVAKRLNEVRESYTNVALNTALVEGQLSTIRAALEALNEWRANDRDSSGPSKQLDKDLAMSLSCCAILISVIDGKLDEAGHRPGLVKKIRYLWLEDILKEYISNLEGQVRALQLLLTIFQCRTEAEKRQRLANEESRTIMEQVRAETASLAVDNRDFQETASILSLDPSVTFDIDSILMQSPAYRRVYGDAGRHRPPVARADPIESSEKAARPTPIPLLNEMPQRPLSPQPAHNPLPQIRGRINVWSYYPSEGEGDKTGDGTIMADSSGVFELSDETQMSNIASRQNDKSREAHDSVLQREETAIKRAARNEEVTGVDSSIGRTPEEKPLSMQTEEVKATALPAAAQDSEPISSLKSFMDQLNLAFAEKNPSQDGSAAALEAEKSSTVAVQEDKTSQSIARKGSKELGHQSKSQSEDLGPTINCGSSSQEQFQRPMSTHSSLYKCSIIPDPLNESTGTSSPYSCDSCKNIDATDFVSDNGLSKPEPLDPDYPSLQSESESAKVQRATTDKSLFNVKLLDERKQKPASAAANISSELQLQPPKDVSPPFPDDATVENNTRNKDHTTSPKAPIDTLAQSELEGLERFEISPSVAGLGLQRVKSPEPNGPQSQKTEELYSSMRPPGHLASRKASAFMGRSAAVFVPLAETGVFDSGQSTTSSDRPSSTHDATSTISSSEPPEGSTILSLQQSTANTTATSITSHAPGLHPDQTLPNLRGLQKELTTAKATGDSRAVKDVLQRSIEAISRKRSTDEPAEDSSPSKQSASPRLGKARSGIMRFPSLLSSTKGVILGALAASGDTTSVQDLLKEKVNVDSRSDNFKTPLMRAAMNGQIECMMLLKQFGADEVAVDANGKTVLHIAVASNRLAVVKWLLENYPPPKIDPLRHRPSILFRATDVVKGVRSQKNLREASDAGGSKPLHIAAELDRGDMVKTLVAAGVDIESKDNWGRTSFHRAIISKSRDSFDTLLRNDAQTATVDAKSVSSLHLAAEAGQVDMIETLLANGAKPWDFDAEGKLPIHSAVCGGNIFAIEALVTQRTDFDRRTKSGQTLLHLACLKTDVGVATYLLTKLVDINPWATPTSGVLQALSQSKIKGSSLTPLHYACCSRDFEMAVLLLDHDALINAPTPEGATALMMAVEAEDTNIVNLLLQRGAKVNAKIPGTLTTALHLAARRGDLETVQQLCRKGADFNARTGSTSHCKNPLEESLKCPDRKKGLAVEEYLRTIITNRLNRNRANARNLEASRTESSPPYYNPSGEQVAGTQQGFVAQQAQGQTPQYYHPDFDVPDEILPAYEPGPSVPAHLANRAPVYRG